MLCVGCSAGWDTRTGLKWLSCSLAIPAQLSAWINFPFQKSAAIRRNALWLSYLDPPLHLQQGSRLLIFFSKQQGKSTPELGTNVHPIPVVTPMSGGVGQSSERVPHLDDWHGCTVANSCSLLTCIAPTKVIYLIRNYGVWKKIEIILPYMIFCHFRYLNTSSTKNGILLSEGN